MTLPPVPLKTLEKLRRLARVAFASVGSKHDTNRHDAAGDPCSLSCVHNAEYVYEIAEAGPALLDEIFAKRMPLDGSDPEMSCTLGELMQRSKRLRALEGLAEAAAVEHRQLLDLYKAVSTWNEGPNGCADHHEPVSYCPTCVDTEWREELVWDAWRAVQAGTMALHPTPGLFVEVPVTPAWFSKAGAAMLQRLSPLRRAPTTADEWASVLADVFAIAGTPEVLVARSTDNEATRLREACRELDALILPESGPMVEISTTFPANDWRSYVGSGRAVGSAKQLAQLLIDLAAQLGSEKSR